MRDKILVFIFSSFLGIVLLGNFLKEDNLVSLNERRTLQTFPDFTVEKILNGEFFKDFDDYANDQFIGRNSFLKIKGKVAFNIFHQKDNNGLYIMDDHLFKLEYPYNKDALLKTINKINYVYEKYLTNNQVYYAIIPDKNYFIDSNYLKINYSDMVNIINNSFDFTYIDLFNKLTLSDYYYTDPHIKQDGLDRVISSLVSNMQNNYFNTTYNKNVLSNFKGSYASQLGFYQKTDEMVYLTNDDTVNAIVYYLENKDLNQVYNLSKYNGMDPYDIFLDGASAFIEITNNNLENGIELVVFRDSFGSAIAPLLIPYYEKITLIDLRYLSSDLLNNYIEFNNQDVLFLYSTLIYNTNILK